MKFPNFMKSPKKKIGKIIKAKLAIVGTTFAIKIIPMLILIVTATSIIDFVVEIFTAKNTPEKIYETLEIEDIADIIQIKGNEKEGYYLDFIDDIDKKLDDLIETLNTSSEFHSVPTDNQFLKKIIKAEVVTKFPNLGGKIPDGSEGFQGAIDIKRVTPNKQPGEMKNTGKGETNILEPEISYNDSQITPSEERIKTWEKGKDLSLYRDGQVYEKEKGKWIPRLYEDSKKSIEISKSEKVKYTGKYETVKDRLNDVVNIYVEVTGKGFRNEKVTGYVKSTIIDLRTTEEQNDEKEDEGNNESKNGVNKIAGNIEDKSRNIASRAKEDKETERIIVGEEKQEYTVAIAAGHNNTDDKGASSGELKEEELTIKVAEKVEELVKKRYKNVKIVQTGSTSKNPGGINVKERTELARKANPNLCIQIHFNAADSADVNGVEAIYKDQDGISQQLAEILSKTISKEMGLEDRKAGTDLEKCAVGSLGIIENAANSHFPSVVTEGGFLTGNKDAEVIRNGGVEKYAEGIVQGIKEYLEADHSQYSSYAPGKVVEKSSIESKVFNMKYVSPEEFENKKSKSVNEALGYFTLNEDKKLVTLSWNRKNDGSIEIKENSPMDFRSSLQKYVMPYEYLLYYYIDTGYRDFSEKLADIVLNSEIVIAIQDNVLTTHTVIENQQSEIVDKNAPKGQGKGWHSVGIAEDSITEMCSTKIDITYIETWCIKVYKDNSYSKKVLNMKNKDEILIVNVPGKVSESKGEATLSSETVVESGERETGRVDKDGNPIKYKYQILNRTSTKVDTIRNSYDTSGDTKIEGETNKFVDLYINEHMNERIKEEWLFYILENNEKTVNANLVDLTKYLMFLSSNTDYGVTEFNFEDKFSSKFSSSAGLYGSSIQEKVWFAILGAGYSKEAAAGVLGNIQAESGFNPGVIEGGSGIGFGLCQWSFGRRTQIESYAASKGKDPSDENTQIEFLIGEITPGGGADGFATYQLMNYNGYSPSDWENASTPESAAIAFCWTFERPGIPRMDVRTEAARRYYEEFKDKERPSAGGNVLEVCEQIMNDMIGRNVNYSVTNLTWGNIDAAAEYPYTCCATYVSIVLYKAGLLTADQINAYNYNYTGSGGIPDMLAAAGWTQVSHSEIQPGDIINEAGVHVLIYAGGNLVYDQNCGVISSSGRPPIGGPYEGWSQYNGKSNVQVWRAP